MEMRMQITGKIIDKIKTASPAVVRIFTDAMRDASTAVMEATIKAAPASTGMLRKSIRREISSSGLQAYIFPVVAYGNYLHGPFGSSDGAHSKPHLIPAREAQEGGSLYRWAKKKGLNPWAVRNSIKKKGTKFNPFLEKAAKQSEVEVEKIFNTAIEKVAQTLGD